MLLSKSRRMYSNMFLSADDVTKVSYIPAKNKAVVLLSSQHHDQSISTLEHIEPIIILDYNRTKGAVESVDKMLKEFSDHGILNRWAFVLLKRINNVYILDAYVLYKKISIQKHQRRR